MLLLFIVIKAGLSAFWLRSKCSICSYQLNSQLILYYCYYNCIVNKAVWKLQLTLLFQLAASGFKKATVLLTYYDIEYIMVCNMPICNQHSFDSYLYFRLIWGVEICHYLILLHCFMVSFVRTDGCGAIYVWYGKQGAHAIGTMTTLNLTLKSDPNCNITYSTNPNANLNNTVGLYTMIPLINIWPVQDASSKVKLTRCRGEY